MSRTPSAFRQTDLTRAIKGARNAGLEVTRAEISKDGKIVIVMGQAAGKSIEIELTPDAELERWKRTK